MVATEWDDVLTNASESEIVELAGQYSFCSVYTFILLFDPFAAILGFTGLINQVQYHAALNEKGLPTVSAGWNGRISRHLRPSTVSIFVVAAAKSEPLRLIPPEPDNTTDVEDCIRKAKANDKELIRININNIREIKAEILKDLLNALKENTNVKTLEMANVGMTDSVGRVCRNDENEFSTSHAWLSSTRLGPCRASDWKFNIEDNQCWIQPSDRFGHQWNRSKYAETANPTGTTSLQSSKEKSTCFARCCFDYRKTFWWNVTQQSKVIVKLSYKASVRASHRLVWDLSWKFIGSNEDQILRVNVSYRATHSAQVNCAWEVKRKKDSVPTPFEELLSSFIDGSHSRMSKKKRAWSMKFHLEWFIPMLTLSRGMHASSEQFHIRSSDRKYLVIAWKWKSPTPLPKTIRSCV